MVALFAGSLAGTAAAQDLPLTKPKEELAVELLHARSYSRGVELYLEKVKKKFPRLKGQVLLAETAWKSSPFALGAKAIDDDIRKEGGKQGVKALAEIDTSGLKLMKELGTDPQSEEEAADFLLLVMARAKGEIEFPTVRGHLLWHYPPYRDAPEKEFLHGFVAKQEHIEDAGVSFSVPMSWKRRETKVAHSMSYKSSYGHGFITTTVMVQPYPALVGLFAEPEEIFKEYTEEAAKEELESQGLALTSFSKTRLNGMPAAVMTTRQEVEQLGAKIVMEGQIIQVLAKKKFINFMILSPAPPDSDAGLKRLKVYDPVFRQVAGSLQVAK